MRAAPRHAAARPQRHSEAGIILPELNLLLVAMPSYYFSSPCNAALPISGAAEASEGGGAGVRAGMPSAGRPQTDGMQRRQTRALIFVAEKRDH